MPPFSPSRPVRPPAMLPDGLLLGTGLVVTGLALAFLTLDTSLAARLVTGGWSGTAQLPYAALTAMLGLVAGAALLLAGTDRLAAIIATMRPAAGRGTPVATALGGLTGHAVVIKGVVPFDGRPVPFLVVGPFGVAVVHEMAGRDRLRQVDGGWQERTANGWVPTEAPLDRATREAQRVRHWLTHGELDFVVRVYAALVSPEGTIARSSQCAVIGAEQIPAWIDGLPHQRSLHEGRQNRLVARAREAAGSHVPSAATR